MHMLNLKSYALILPLAAAGCSFTPSVCPPPRVIPPPPAQLMQPPPDLLRTLNGIISVSEPKPEPLQHR
ncbi:hypothetical protein NAD57_004721 [Salmonella enterica]|nr:hypothetical protein [Salmonella enterica]